MRAVGMTRAYSENPPSALKTDAARCRARYRQNNVSHDVRAAECASRAISVNIVKGGRHCNGGGDLLKRSLESSSMAMEAIRKMVMKALADGFRGLCYLAFVLLAGSFVIIGVLSVGNLCSRIDEGGVVCKNASVDPHRSSCNGYRSVERIHNRSARVRNCRTDLSCPKESSWLTLRSTT